MKMKRSLFLLFGVLIFLFTSCNGAEVNEAASDMESESATEMQTDDPTQTFLAKEAIQEAWGRYIQNNDYNRMGAVHTGEVKKPSRTFTVENLIPRINDGSGPFLIQIRELYGEYGEATYFEVEILHDYWADTQESRDILFGEWGTQAYTTAPLFACGDLYLIPSISLDFDPIASCNSYMATMGKMETIRVVRYEGMYYGVSEWNDALFNPIENPMTEEEISAVITACNLEEKSRVIPYDVLETYILNRIGRTY